MMSRHSTAVYWRGLKYEGRIRGFAGCTWTSALGLHARVRVGTPPQIQRARQDPENPLLAYG